MKKAARFVKNGLSVRQAALKTNIPITTLHCYLKQNGVVSGAQKSQRYNASQKERARELRQLGMSYEEISKQTKVNRTSIISWCSDIQIKPEQIKINSGSLIEKQQLAIDMRRSGKFITEISKELCCAKSSVSLWLKNHQRDTGENLNSVCDQRKIQKLSTSSKRKLQLKEVSDRISSKWIDKDFVEDVASKRKLGMSFYEIGREMGVSRDVAQRAIKNYNFSDEEKDEIQIKLKQRLRWRIDSGDVKPQGGARQGSGRAKTGYYKGIYCGSTYELCWVIHSLDHGVEFSRFPGSLKSGKVTYYPDFLLSDQQTIVELKGYEDEVSVRNKTEVAEKHGYKVIVLRKSDLEFSFKHIKEKYGVDPKNSYVLYDNFKPSHKYICGYCGMEFHTEKKKKKAVTFCSRSCSGKNQAPRARSVPGRIKRGDKKLGFRSKLSKDDVVSVFNSTDTYNKIAEQYKINKSMVSFIKNKKVHKELLKDL